MGFFKDLPLRRYLKKRKSKKPTLQERFQSFQELLHANNEALEIMGDMDEKYFGEDYLLDRQYIRASYNKIRERVYQMIEALNRMVPDQYNQLYKAFEQIDQGIQKKVFGKREIPISPLTLPLADITQEMNEKVGEKMPIWGKCETGQASPYRRVLLSPPMPTRFLSKKMFWIRKPKKN